MLVDLSHTVEDGMITYPGLPGPTISDHWTRESTRAAYAEGTEFHIGRIDMIANTGTYLDTPAHRYADGYGLDELALERCADLPGVIVDGPAEGAVDVDRFTGVELGGRAVLVRTGWDRHWRTDRYGDAAHPFVTEDACRLLADAGAALVGIDSVNIDDTRGDTRPAHSTLLAAGIPIVEHLRGLDALTAAPFRFFAVPVKVRGMGTFPVRAFARVEAA